jgi:hypothetical protein
MFLKVTRSRHPFRTFTHPHHIFPSHPLPKLSRTTILLVIKTNSALGPRTIKMGSLMKEMKQG